MNAALADLQLALGSRYQIERELGRGGMATVYLARDLEHDRGVAIKVLRPELSGMLGADRFAREIAIAARLHHPHILPIYQSGKLETAGEPALFYTMPFVPGQSVRDRLDEQAQLPVEEAVSIARQVADALDHAHSQGVVHRDIKPENILLDGSSSRDRDATEVRAMVADFGIARALDAAGGERLTQTGLALGTPAYMSPEQGAGLARLDGRSDVYSLGCVLYEMLAGEPPFTGPTAQAILARHAMDPAPSLHTARPTVSPRLARVVLRALAKVPADRYPTAGAFAEALEAAGQDTTIAGDVAPASVRRKPVFLRRRPRLVVVAITGVAAIGLAYGLVARRRGTPTAKLDPTLIAIAPFRVTAATSSLGYLREGIVDLLAAKLGGTLALRPIDTRTMLSTWRQAGSGGRGLTERKALAVATRLGAGQLIEGEIAGGSRVTMSATLLQSPDGAVRGQTSVEGPADSLTSLVDQLAVRLLILGAGEPEERLASLASTPLPVLRLYLDGQVTWRRGSDPDLAQKRFEQALAGDSSFALAALWVVRSLFEGGAVRASEPAAQAAWKLRDSLPAADRAYLSLFLGDEWHSMRDQLEAIAAFTRRYPQRADGWGLYGDMLAAAGVLLGVPEAKEKAKSAYARALALDAVNPGPLMGYILLAADLGDSAGVKSALARYRSVDSVSPLGVALQWRVAKALGDTAKARRILLSDSLVSPHANASAAGPVWVLSTTLGAEGVGLRDLDLLLRRSLAVSPTGSQRDRLREISFYLEIMRGRGTGLTQPAWGNGSWPKAERVLDALFADGDPSPAVPAAVALEREAGRPIVDDCCIPRFAAAQAAIASGRLGPARQALADLLAYHPQDPDSAAARRGTLGYAAIIAAQLAVLDRPPPADGYLRRLDSVLTNPPSTWDFVMLYGNLIDARLHETRGEFGAALAAIRRCDWTSFWPVLVTYHREEGRIAAEAGDTAGAIRAYRRFLGIRADAEPRLQPQVFQVRAALAALERASARR